MQSDYKDDNRFWYLLAKKTANETTEAENAELADLLQQHPEALYAEEIITQQWHDSYKKFDETTIDGAFEKHMLRLQNTPTGSTLNNTGEIAENKRGIYWKMFLRYASVAAACIVVALFIFKGNDAVKEEPQQEVLQEIATQHGAKSQLILPDGTKVWLNAGSKLNYPKQFSNNNREVTLEGEAYFDVTEDKSKPFWVHTKAFTVKVLGTAFNIRAYNDEDSAATSLIRGSVEVNLVSGKKDKILLHPNEKLTVPVRTDEETASPVTKIAEEQKDVITEVKKTHVTTDRSNTVIETAWISNKLAFKNMTFQQIASSLEKWFAVEIKFRNDAKKKLRLSGTFEGESLDEILTAFSMANISGDKEFSYKKDSAGVIWIY